MRKMLFMLSATLLMCFVAISQNLTIKGRVTDEKGEAVSSAAIRIKNGRGGVTADEKGFFTVKVAKGDILVVSSTGFLSSEVKVTGEDNIIIVINRSVEELSTVVVTTAFGIRRQPKELGYATQNVTNKELTKANATNISNALAGKVSGLQIQQQNSSVNADTRINLRGNRSILGNNSALVVVDGVLVQASVINSINPNDVESLNVLKGAAASTLYGSDGANGVLIITTKKGTKGKPIIRFSSNFQIEDAAILPNLQTEYGSYGGEQGQYQDPVSGNYLYVPFENQSYGPRFNGALVALGTPKRFYRADGTFFDTTQMVPYSALPNEKRKFFSGGLTLQNDLSISMGDEKSSTFVSLQNVVTRGVLPNDELRRTTARLNGSREYNNFKVDYAVSYAQRYTNTTGTNWNGRSVYYTVINTPMHVPIRSYQNSQSDFFATGDGWFNAYDANPWWAINNSRNTQRRDDITGNIGLSYKFTPWLSASYRAGFSSSNFVTKNSKQGIRFSDYTITTNAGISDTRSSTKFTNPSSADASTFFSKLTGDALLTANKDFGKISTKVIIGHNFIKDDRRDISLGANALSIPNFYNVSSQSGVPTYSEAIYKRTIQGAFADATIGYDGYLYLHGAYRSSWYSTLPQQNRNFNYGGGDISFILSDALPQIFKNNTISFAKIRASYAVVGQLSTDNLSPYGTYLVDNTFSSAAGFPYGNTTGYVLSPNNNNPNLKDERTKEMEIGLELGFFKNRINLQVNAYKTNTINQTLPAQVSTTTGYSSNLINSGEVQNKGIEVDLKFTPILSNKSGFRWDFGINYTYIDNKVLALPSGDVFLGGNSYAIVGQPIQALKVSDWVRSPDGYVVVDANGNPSQNSTLVYAGSYFAPHRIGINTSVSYKNLSLSITADYRGGNRIFNDVGQDLDRGGISEHSTYGNRERFVFPNSVYKDASGKYVPNTSRNIGDVYNFWSGIIPNVDMPYVTSAAFWKLREVNLSYELPKKWVNSLKYVKNITFSAFGRNLLTWRPKENIWADPEFNDNIANNDGGTTSSAQNPSTRYYGGSIQITF